MVTEPRPDNLPDRDSHDSDTPNSGSTQSYLYDEDSSNYDGSATNELAHNELARNELARNELRHNRPAQDELASNELAYNELAHNELASNVPASSVPARPQPDLSSHPLHNLAPPSTGLAQSGATQVTLSPQRTAYPAQRAMPRERTDGVTILSLYHLALGLLTMAGAFIMAIPTVITGIVGSAGEPDIFWITAILGVATFFLMGLALMYFLVGIGLWRLKQWSRTAALALAVVSLPTGIGTIPGALTLWYLLKREVSSLFR